MIGTAGLPHILIRFFTVPKMRDARSSAGYALICIALLYTTAPAIAVFARTNFIKSIHNVEYAKAPVLVQELGKNQAGRLERQERRRHHADRQGQMG